MTMHSARIGKSLASGLLGLFLGFAASAHAAAPPLSIVDLNLLDLNSITGQQAGPGNGLTVTEDYNEATLVPYASHDGWAIVNPQLGWFDKVVSFQGQGGPAPVVALNFVVLNTGPYTWSDYHFEFWNPSFTARLELPVDSLSSTIFQNHTPAGILTAAEFWAPQWQSSQATGEYLLQIDLSNLPVDQNGNGSFGVRQIATTVPESETYAMLLAGLGLLGLAARRRNQK